MLDTRYPAEDILYAGSCCYLTSGKVVSKGFDMEINGEVARGVSLYAGYTCNQNRDETENAVFSTITPKHSLKFFGTWQLPGVAAAWNATARNWTGGSVPFAYTQPGYAVWNLMAEYRIDPRRTVAPNLNNAFDKWYCRTVGNATSGNYYGEPRNWMVTLRGRF